MRQNQQEVLAHHIRRCIYETIKGQPGICIRELERTLRISMGQLMHHLPLLLASGIIHEEVDEHFRRFFTTDLDSFSRKMYSFFRREAVRKVIPLFLSMKQVTNKDVSLALGISPPTANWHIKRMKANNLLLERKAGNKIYYALKDIAAIRAIYKIG